MDYTMGKPGMSWEDQGHTLMDHIMGKSGMSWEDLGAYINGLHNRKTRNIL